MAKKVDSDILHKTKIEIGRKFLSFSIRWQEGYNIEKLNIKRLLSLLNFSVQEFQERGNDTIEKEI